MNNNAEDPKNDNNGQDGFVWSQRLTLIAGFVVAVALAAVHYAPVLASPLEWLPH